MRTIRTSKVEHLDKIDIIKNGCIFTPKEIVDLVYKKIDKHIDTDTYIMDFGAGYGAFLEPIKNKYKNIIATEIDEQSYHLLKFEFPNIKIINENSLINVSRKKYNLKENTKLVIVGNPPYNDITSLYKKGEKGKIECDSDFQSRDFGISFLKMYCSLNPNFICVLHPLAYLIKKQNFNSLGKFKDNYRLLNATIFSSEEFETIKKSNAKFPVVAALYERNECGMDFDYISKFKFKIYKSKNTLVYNNINTIDGVINKYPKKGHHNGLQFYTIRDMNALNRNAGFVDSGVQNGIEVTIDNLYKYSWLNFLKENFNPPNNKYIYGNLSPLCIRDLDDTIIKNLLVSYAFYNNALVRKHFTQIELEKAYGKLNKNYELLFDELNKLYIFN